MCGHSSGTIQTHLNVQMSVDCSRKLHAAHCYILRNCQYIDALWCVWCKSLKESPCGPAAADSKKEGAASEAAAEAIEAKPRETFV